MQSILATELIAEKFYPTKKIARSWFHIINDEIFKNKLILPSIVIRRLRGTWAFYDDDTEQIELTNWYPSKHLFLNIMAHEMIHVYQHQNNQPLGHGPSFWTWEKPFKRKGLWLFVVYQGEIILK